MAEMAAVMANVCALVRSEPLPPLHGGAYRPSRQYHCAGVHQRVSRHDRHREAKGRARRDRRVACLPHSFFGLHKVNTCNIAKLLGALKQHTKPVRPVELGIIGKEHLYRLMEAAGGDSKTFTYNRTFGETGGIPRVVEFAFGIHCEGLNNAGRGPSRKVITGVNCSPGINNPFRQIGRDGEGLDGILSEVRANTSQPVIAVLHLACPRVAYTDRGKSAIVVEGDAITEDNE